MKKHIKLLLLGGIFTLIGIFNFSSAYDYSSPVEYSCGSTVNRSCGVVDIPSSALGVKIFDLSLSNGNLTFAHNLDDKLFSYFSAGDYLFSDFTFTPSEFMASFRSEGGYFKYSFIYPEPPLIEGGTSTFTPIITGLINSVNEFIPYVVYVGIGLLTAVIGFVAIKRLINWVRAKIFSSFKR